MGLAPVRGGAGTHRPGSTFRSRRSLPVRPGWRGRGAIHPVTFLFIGRQMSGCWNLLPEGSGSWDTRVRHWHTHAQTTPPARLHLFPLNRARRCRPHAVLQSCSLLQPGSILRHKSHGIMCPLRFASSDSAVSVLRAQVQSLGGELRSHKPCGMAKKGKRGKKRDGMNREHGWPWGARAGSRAVGLGSSPGLPIRPPLLSLQRGRHGLGGQPAPPGGQHGKHATRERGDELQL